MVAPEGDQYAPYPTPEAAEALVRSLVGVAAVSLRADAGGALREIVIIPERGACDRRVGRDVLSALKARFGVSLAPGAITITGPEAETENRQPLDPDRPGASASAKNRDRNRAQGEPNRNGILSGASEAVKRRDPERATEPTPAVSKHAGPTAAVREAVASGGSPRETPNTRWPGAPDRAPRLERVQLETMERGLRCRIELGVGDERFHGVAEAAAGFTTEAELAARVTLDAMRSARTPREPLQFRGASLLDVAGQPHVVVSLALWTGTEFKPLAGAEPVGESVARAAARAVLGSVIAYRPGAAPPGA